MRTTVKQVATYVTTLALLVCISPLAAWAEAPGARLEGLVLGVDSRHASDHTVYLIDGEGQAQAESPVVDGKYAFRDVPPGSYGLGVETPSGEIAPVAAPPVRLGSGQLARRDLKLVESDPATVNRAAKANYGVGLWFAGLTGAAKAGIIVALLAATYGVVEAVDDDDDPPASPTS